ncbi:MAG TPA: patatin-like phospholipase family protein [Thiobacillaceae bacterium]|nr:patatin-like phospholipase family protein [Thiobacillaceae bacterium]
MASFLSFRPGILILLILVGAAPTHAVGDGPKRPRIGLVLGGGGARGAAHIGVLEVLERLHVPVDCVAGTSMGALVGGAYAAGLSPAEMRAELAKVNWKDLFNDFPDFSEQAYRSKNLAQRFIPGTELGVSAGGLRTLPSLVQGQKIKLFFNRLVRSNLGERNIESLPLPLSIVASDIGNGDRVVFRDGSLTAAMRASMAIPGLMSPYDYRGHKLVDGALVDNVPIAEVRDRCQPDVVIAVDVGSPLLKPDQVGSLVTVLAQTVNILTEQNVTHSLATLTPQDIYIKPDLDGIGSADFANYAKTADRGGKAAEAFADRLRALAVSEKEYAAWWNGIRFTKTEAPRVDAIEVAGLRYVNPQAVERHIEQRPGEPADADELDKDIMRIYGDGYYETVDYSLLSIRNRNILRVTPVEKPWGKDYLRFGMNLSTSVKDSTYTLRGTYQRTWLNSLGAELLLGGQIGSEPGVFADFYQPLEGRQHFFLEPAFELVRRKVPVYQDNHRIAEYDVNDTSLTLLAGANIGVLGQARLGWIERQKTASLATGAASLPEGRTRYGAWVVGIDLDQFDRLYFPTRGWTAKLDYSQPSGQGYTKLVTDLRGALSIGDYVIQGRLHYVDSPHGVLPVYDSESLGGTLNLSGFAPRQIVGDQIRYGSLRAEKIIGRLPLGLRGDMRLGVGLEAGKVDHRYTETDLQGWLNSVSLYLGGETPLGAAFLGYGYSTRGSSLIYLFIGTP